MSDDVKIGVWRDNMNNIKKIIKELFYRKEVEIYRVGVSNEYGIRWVWRSRIKTPDGVSGWRNYSERRGDYIQIPTKEMLRIIDEAKDFVRVMK